MTRITFRLCGLPFLLLALAAGLHAQRSSAWVGNLPVRASPVPNVLVILADDIGWGDIGPAVATPSIDALARRGVSFRRAYSMPYCSPTRFALLFGAQPFREQLGTYIDPNLPGDVSVSPTWLALPQALSRFGYGTLAAGKWHLSTFAAGIPAAFEWPRRFGFDAYRAGRIGNIGGTVGYTNWPRIDDGVRTQSTQYNTSAIVDATRDWWRARSGPKFAYVAFHAAHAPFHLPPAGLLPPGTVVGADHRSRYEAMVTAMDTEVGRLLSEIDLENTFVFFLGDNGTPPDAIAPGQVSARVKGSVYEGGIRVPLMVAGPGVPPSRTSEALVSVTDLFATVMDLLHSPVPTGHAIDSVSFGPQMFWPELPGRPWVYSQEFAPNGPSPKLQNQRAVISRRYKLITDNGGESLYDLLLDPQELQPLPPFAHPGIVNALRARQDSMLAQGAP